MKKYGVMNHLPLHTYKIIPGKGDEYEGDTRIYFADIFRSCVSAVHADSKFTSMKCEHTKIENLHPNASPGVVLNLVDLSCWDENKMFELNFIYSFQ